MHLQQFKKSETAFIWANGNKTLYRYLYCFISGSHFVITNRLTTKVALNLVFAFENQNLIIDYRTSYPPSLITVK